jgi:hypothetical protein
MFLEMDLDFECSHVVSVADFIFRNDQHDSTPETLDLCGSLFMSFLLAFIFKFYLHILQSFAL